MKSVTLKINFTESEWEVLKDRAEKWLSGMQEELEEPFSLNDAIENEIRYSVSADLELFDVYDYVRNYSEVRHAVKAAIKQVSSLED